MIKTPAAGWCVRKAKGKAGRLVRPDKSQSRRGGQQVGSFGVSGEVSPRDGEVAVGEHHPSQPPGHVDRMLMVASFPLRVMCQGREAPTLGSLAAVHHYGRQGQTSTVNSTINARRHIDA